MGEQTRSRSSSSWIHHKENAFTEESTQDGIIIPYEKMPILLSVSIGNDLSDGLVSEMFDWVRSG